MLGIGIEAMIFLYAGLTGIVIFCSYQILRFFRYLIPHYQIIISIEDFLFWIGISAYVFHQMYYTTYGTIRWFSIIGLLVGAALSGVLFIVIKKIYRKTKKHLEK